MASDKPSITVIGSINTDLVVRCHAFARAGETIIAESLTEIGGGKGANQAVAAAKAGGHVRMIGRVGDDSFANRMLESLQAIEIDCDGVSRTAGCASGLAVDAVLACIAIAKAAGVRVIVDPAPVPKI